MLQQLNGNEEQLSATKLDAVEEETKGSEGEIKRHPKSGDEELGADWKQAMKQQTAGIMLEDTEDMVANRERWLLQCEETIQTYKEQFQQMESENKQLRKQIRKPKEEVQVLEGESTATGMLYV